jgi:catechol 2,3-dioxygenase-like lactoylglutathione lyase family enzyme
LKRRKPSQTGGLGCVLALDRRKFLKAAGAAVVLPTILPGSVPGQAGIAPVQSQERKTTMSQKGRILGIGGIFFKSANRKQLQEWYAKHLGLANGGHGVMLPLREKDNPASEYTTVWNIFPATTKYFEPGPASFMVNYIVDDLEALLDRPAKEGVHIDPKRQNESYGRFAWIYDSDGNKIELWEPAQSKK